LVLGFTTLMIAIAIGATAFAQAPPVTQPKAAEPQQPELIYSPWTKLCFRGPQAQLACASPARTQRSNLASKRSRQC